MDGEVPEPQASPDPAALRMLVDRAELDAEVAYLQDLTVRVNKAEALRNQAERDLAVARHLDDGERIATAKAELERRESEYEHLRSKAFPAATGFVDALLPRLPELMGEEDTEQDLRRLEFKLLAFRWLAASTHWPRTA